VGSKRAARRAERLSREGGLLTFKVAALILLILILFLVPLVWTVDSVLRERLILQAQQELQQQDRDWLNQLQNDIRTAEQSISVFAQLVQSQLRPPRDDDDRWFHQMVERNDDGLWRSRRANFDPTRQAGIWAPDGAVATLENRSFFLQAQRLAQIFGQAANHGLLANTWILPADNGEIVFWPEQPEFIYQTTPDQDYRPTEWFQGVSPEKRPHGGVHWTATSFDPVPKVWMISVVAPFQREGRWGGSVGHDVVIEDLVQRITTDLKSDEGEFFLIDQQQRLLVATRHQAAIEQAQGQLRAADLQERGPLLGRILQQAGPGPVRQPVIMETGDDLVTALPLLRPDWMMVHIVPRSAARSLVEGPLRWLRWGLAISMLVLLAACGLVISRDTLQRVRAERELRDTLATLQNFESFINRSPAVVFLWKAEPCWPVEFVSDNVAQFGYDARDLMSGKVSWVSTLNAEDLPYLEAEVEKNRDQGRTEFVLTYRLNTPEGETRWVETRTLLLTDGYGKLRQVQGIMLDITERQRIQTELQAEQQRYQTLFNHSGAAIIYYDTAGCLQMTNDAACRMLQRDADYLKGRRLEDVLPLAMAAQTRERIEQGLLHPITQTFEDEMDLPGGTRWYISTFTTIQDPQGRAMGVLVVAQDVSGRKAAESALAESQARYQVIVETTQEGMWMVDTQARTTFVNQRMAEMLGYTPDEMMGRPLFDFMDQEAIRQAEKNFERRKQGVKEVHDFRFQRKDGTYVWTLVSTNPLEDKQRRFVGSLALITDITERKRNEQERHKLEMRVQQAKKLESLGILAAGIAHDFNNLLQAILGHAELALQDAAPASPQAESLVEIKKSAERAGIISSQMMTYVGQGSYQRSLMPLDKALQDLLPSLKNLVGQKALLTLECDPGLPPAWADQAEFSQCILQLVNNAVEAQGSEPGRIAIHASRPLWQRHGLLELFGAPELNEGPYLTITVTDNGCGIDRAAMQHLFEPFFTTKFPGRGLGLMRVLGFVRGHGGGVGVQSKPREGTTVTLVLPEAPADRVQKSEPMPWGWRGQGTVLLVDDEAAVLNVGRRLLTELGFTVITAGDGQEALDVLQKNADDIRCVVLDLVMAGMDGAQTLAGIRAHHAELPVLIATAYPAQQATDLLQNLTYHGLIHKPYSGAALARLLQSLLG
jgi:two-component system cell cycle sensor histidine kinase/response regulator CckA